MGRASNLKMEQKAIDIAIGSLLMALENSPHVDEDFKNLPYSLKVVNALTAVTAMIHKLNKNNDGIQSKGNDGISGAS